MLKDLRTKTDYELVELIEKLKIQLLETRFKMANGELEAVHKRKEIKKTIAKAMTVLSERNVKIFFTSTDTQLIKEKNGKQEITSFNKISEKNSSNKTDKNDSKKSTTSKKTSEKKPVENKKG